jgi:hypothetical protein
MLNSSYIALKISGVQLLFEGTKHNVAIWTTGIIIWHCNMCDSYKRCGKKPHTNETVGVAIVSKL